NDRGGLRKAISFHDRHPGGGEYAGQTWLQGCTSGNHDRQPAPKAFHPFAKDQFSGKGQLPLIPPSVLSVGLEFEPDLHGPEENTPFYALELAPLAHDGLIYLFQQPWDHRHHMGLDFFDVLGYFVHSFRKMDLDPI